MASSSVKMARCGDCREIKIIKRRGMCHTCSSYFYRTGDHRRPGLNGCNTNCILWKSCKAEQRNGYTGPLPCEATTSEDNPDLYEAAPGLNMQRPISVEIELRIAV